MQPPASQKNRADSRSAELATALAAVRSRAGQSLANRRAELTELEGRLETEFQTVADRLAEQLAQSDERQSKNAAEATQLEAAARQLDADRQTVEEIRQGLATEREAWEQEREVSLGEQEELAGYLQTQQDELALLRREFEAEATQLRLERQALETSRQELIRDEVALADARADVGRERTSLVQERTELTEERAATKQQRQRIALQLREQRAALFQEIARQRDELRAGATADSGEAAALAGQLDRASAALEQSRCEAEELREELAEQQAASEAAQAELGQLRWEQEVLRARVAELESGAPVDVVDDELQTKLDELERRFELAIGDVRELKLRNAELEEELAESKSRTGVMASRGGAPQVLDWEAQKRKLLAALEEEDEGDAARECDREERLTIEGAIQITDEVVAEKDREIAELKRLLEDQSSSLGGVAVGAAAIAGMLDTSDLVQEERKRLARLQSEWEEKLRQAEIDISVERAKIARERSALDEKLRNCEAKLAELEAKQGHAAVPAKEGKPARSRWLSRLGLDGDDA